MLLFLFLGGINVAHSRIFQITTEPVLPEDLITENDFYEHWFLQSVADYVSDESDRPADIEWLRERLINAADFDTDDSFSILPNGKEAYFSKAYEAFVYFRQKTMELGLSEFSSGEGFTTLVYTMGQTCNEEFGLYVVQGDSDDFEVVTLDEFIRFAEIGCRYYIGAILDYHY